MNPELGKPEVLFKLIVTSAAATPADKVLLGIEKVISPGVVVWRMGVMSL